MKQMHGFAVHKTKTIEKRCSSNQENKLVCLEIFPVTPFVNIN
jgi:hypothetical protein